MQNGIKVVNTTDEDGNPAGGSVSGVGIGIVWQDGPLGRGDERQAPNGAFVEDVLNACRLRLEFYQSSRFACVENAAAIQAIETALDSLEARTAGREKRGVEGIHKP